MCHSSLKIPPFPAKIEEKGDFEKFKLFLPSLTYLFVIVLIVSNFVPEYGGNLAIKYLKNTKHKNNEEYVHEKR